MLITFEWKVHQRSDACQKSMTTRAGAFHLKHHYKGRLERPFLKHNSTRPTLQLYSYSLGPLCLFWCYLPNRGRVLPMLKHVGKFWNLSRPKSLFIASHGNMVIHGVSHGISHAVGHGTNHGVSNGGSYGNYEVGHMSVMMSVIWMVRTLVMW